jgi:hypothetical protein
LTRFFAFCLIASVHACAPIEHPPQIVPPEEEWASIRPRVALSEGQLIAIQGEVRRKLQDRSGQAEFGPILASSDSGYVILVCGRVKTPGEPEGLPFYGLYTDDRGFFSIGWGGMKFSAAAQSTTAPILAWPSINVGSDKG